MNEAAKLADITNQNSSIGKFFALEPEAAVYYVSSNNLSNDSIIIEGNKYAICDLGGGTVDFVIQERTKEGCKESKWIKKYLMKQRIKNLIKNVVFSKQYLIEIKAFIILLILLINLKLIFKLMSKMKKIGH